MRNLYIVGNGFDIAHTLKTRYSDFLDNYFKRYLIKARQSSNKTYEDDLIKISDRSHATGLKIAEKGYKSILQHTKGSTEITISVKNALLQKVVDNVSDRWVDIEMTYNNMLVGYFKRHETNNNESFLNQALKVVDGLECLKNELKNYIITEVEPNIDGLKKTSAFVNFKELFKDFNNGVDRVLSFNYTTTPSLYVDTHSIIPIHDIAKDVLTQNQPQASGRDIIFGYGDERSKYYQGIEDLNINKLLNHSKSFGYFRHSNYLKLLEFLNMTGKFKVHVLGHSCGLSDRTLLSKVFEHERCVSIQIYYYKTFERYFETTQEISRHFENIDKMRAIVRPFNECIPCPQMD